MGVDVLTTTIIRVPKDGSSPEPLAQLSGLDRKANFIIDGQYLYFEGNQTGEIDQLALADGAVVPLIDSEVTPFPEGFASFPGINGLASDGTNLFYSGNDQGMFQVPIAGGQPLLISPPNTDDARFSGPNSWPAVKDGVVYWNYYGYIYSVPVGGGDLVTVVEPTDLERSGSGPYTVIDGDYVYYIDRGLQKAALDGSDRTVVEGTADVSGGFTFDETSVYLWTYSGQGIIKVPK